MPPGGQMATYHPIKEINILLLGDILDPLHSTLWLEKRPGESGYVRPWTDFRAPEFAATLHTITSNILKSNAEAMGILKGLSGKAGLSLPPATRSGQPDMDANQREPVNVRIHYMVGNHDWYYHLPGPAFDAIREEIVQSCGLSNPPGPFPHELHESQPSFKACSRDTRYLPSMAIFMILLIIPRKKAAIQPPLAMLLSLKSSIVSRLKWNVV